MIEQIIYEMNMKIYKEYGIKNAIHTIIMDHKSFDEIVVSLFRSGASAYKFRPSDMNDLHLAGVRVLARTMVKE